MLAMYEPTSLAKLHKKSADLSGVNYGVNNLRVSPRNSRGDITISRSSSSKNFREIPQNTIPELNDANE